MNHFIKPCTVSRAEMQVFEQLSIRGLTHGMVTQKPVILRMTIPDFMWQERKKAVYLDGIQVHGTDRAIENDQEIDALLELKGWSVLRLPYNPPLTGKALAEVMQRIEQFLGEP